MRLLSFFLASHNRDTLSSQRRLASSYFLLDPSFRWDDKFGGITVRIMLCSFAVFIMFSSALAANDCEERKEELRRRIASSGMCEKDDDCVNIWPGCNFGCTATVNRHTVEQLADATRRYKEACGDCEVMCAMGAPAPRCVDGHCTLKQP